MNNFIRKNSALLISSLVVFLFLGIGVLILVYLFSNFYSTGMDYSPQFTIIPYRTSTAILSLEKTNDSRSASTPNGSDQRFSSGLKVKVYGTGSDGLRIHQAAGQSSPTIYLAPEGSVFIVIDGPIVTGGFAWWKIEDKENGNIKGWVVEDYLQIVLNSA